MDNPNYFSLQTNLAGRTLKWYGGDEEELYIKNCQTLPMKLKMHGWKDDTVEQVQYTFNSHGYRCDEFKGQPSIMFLGCSNTFGVGLPIDKIWVELVAKNLNLAAANFSIPGHSSDTAFRLCHGWIDKIKPKIVIFLQPPGVRFELITGPWDCDLYSLNAVIPTEEKFQPWVDAWAVDENNNYFNALKNRMGMELMCQQRNIKFLFLDYEQLGPEFFRDLARDLAHWGVRSNKNFSEYVLSLL